MSQASQASHKRVRLAKHLRVQVANGSRYFKSSTIAHELGLSSKEVGTNLGLLAREVDDLHIEKWAQASKATTWLVEPVDS